MQARKKRSEILNKKEENENAESLKIEQEFNRLKMEQQLYRFLSLFIFLLTIVFILMFSLKGLVLVTAIGLSIASILLFLFVSSLPDKVGSGYSYKQ